MKALWLCIIVASSAFCISIWTNSANSDSVADALIAAPSHGIVDGSTFNAQTQCSYKLTNQSKKPLTIMDVKTCCGATPFRDLKLKKLAAGESCELTMSFNAGEAGIRRDKVEISHSASRVPLIVTADVIGRRPMPYVLNGERQATFFDMREIPSPHEMHITTVESVGMEWLGNTTCDIQGLRVDKRLIGEVRTGPVFVRSYVFLLTWERLPMAAEFFGTMVSKTNYHDEQLALPKEVEIGRIVGTRLLSP